MESSFSCYEDVEERSGEHFQHSDVIYQASRQQTLNCIPYYRFLP